jgi:hypothetical protein
MSRRWPYRRMSVAAAGLALGCAAPSAVAQDLPAAPKTQAAPITLPTGTDAHHASLAVDSDGTAHIVWTVASPSGGGGDQLVYCRLPRGAKSCARTQTFAEDGNDSFGTDVLIPDPGHVILLDERCCPPDATYAVQSTDGGATFSAPRIVGGGAVVSSGNVEAAAAGPGPYQLSFLSSGSGGGIRYETDPLAGPPSGADAQLGGMPHQWYGGGIAFVDPTTPMIATTDLDNTYYQRFNPTKGSNQNDAAQWDPQATIPGENEPSLVGGRSGVFLMTHVKTNAHSSGNDSYAVRPYRAAGGTFGASTLVSDVGDMIRGTFREDAGGGLGLAWLANSGTIDKGRTSGPLRYASSADGGRTWAKTTLVNDSESGAYDLRIGLAPDHGGFLLYDHNNAGPIQLAVIPPGGAGAATGGGGTGSGAVGSCVASVTITAKVTADGFNGGCLRVKGGGKYAADGDVRINGIDFLTGATGKLDIDTGSDTVTASGAVREQAGSVKLHSGALTWDVDHPAKFTGLDSFHVNLLGFKVVGEADVQFVKGGTTISGHVQLPDPFAVTGDVTFHTDQQHGLLLDKVHVGVTPPHEIDVGVLTIRSMSVDYDAAADTFTGDATMVLGGGGDLKAAFGFKQGKFDYGTAIYGGPPLPTIIYPPDVTLNKIGFSVSGTAKTLGPGNQAIVVPGLHLAGGVDLGVGTFGGHSAVEVDALPNGFPKVSPQDGGLSFDFPSGAYPAHLGAGGTIKVAGIALGGGHADFYTSGVFTFGSSFSLGSKDLGVTADVAGAVDVPDGSFYAEGDANVCVVLCVGGSAIISTIGVAACADLHLVSVGIGYMWSDGAHVYFKGCDVGAYKPAGPRSVRDAAAGGTGSVTLKGGVPEGVIRVTGTGGVPGITVSGPGGVSIASDPLNPGAPVAKDGVLLIPNGDDSTATVLIANPAGGAYTVTGNGGTITRIDKADGLPSLTFGGGGATARAAAGSTPTVTGKGRHRTLSYRIAHLDPSQERVELFESSAGGVLHKLGDAKAHGPLPFTVADGPGGTREVLAVVTRGGVPAQRTAIAHFVAPGPITPGRPRSVRVVRTASRLTVRWKAAANAARYVVRVKLSDGRTDTYGVKAGRRLSVRAAALENADHGAITVTAYARNGRAGPAARAAVAAKRAKSRKRAPKQPHAAPKHCPPPGTAGSAACRRG